MDEALGTRTEDLGLERVEARRLATEEETGVNLMMDKWIYG